MVRKLSLCMRASVLALLILGMSVAHAQEDATKPQPVEKNLTWWSVRGCPTEEACKLWEEFREKYNITYAIVKWHKDVPRIAVLDMYLKLNKEVTSKDEAELVARSFLEENKDLFKLDFRELRLWRVLEDYNSFDVYYQQYYQNLTVEGARVSVLIHKEGVISVIGNGFEPNITISTAPNITREEAVEIAKKSYSPMAPNLSTAKNYPVVELVVLPQRYIELYSLQNSEEPKQYLAWKVKFLEETIYVDAHTGEILHRRGNIAIEVSNTNVTQGTPPEKKLEIPPGMEEEWEEFRERYGDAFSKVEWGLSCGCVRELYGYYDTGRGELRTEEEAEALAREFLSENAKLFKVDLSQLRVKKVELDRRGVWTVDYEQYYKDVPVYTGEVRVLMNNKSYLKRVINNFYPGISISTTPSLSRREAVKIVASVTGGPTAGVDKVVLFILPESENGSVVYRLSWRVWSAKELAYYFVNARSGEVLRVEPTAAAYGGGRGEPPTGAEPVDKGFSKLMAAGAFLVILAIALRRWRK